MDEEEFQRKVIIETLEECIKLGLVEVVGINEKGDWLYGATEKGKEVLNSAEGYEAAYEAILAMREDYEDEE
jgi:DNA-binding HxlR family transcriptional regulator